MNTDFTTIKGGKKSDAKWTKEQEELLAEWSEKATCYRWLHSRSEKLYRKRNYTFTIPVIILSTLTGTANFAMDSFVPEEHKQIAMAAVGSVNIFAGILSTLQNFLRYAELMEAHRQSEVLWSKFGRNIAIELTLEPKRRKHPDDFLKTCRQEYDQLIESSPTIDDQIINQFKKVFKNATLKKPDICNGLDECKIYTPSKEEKIENMVSNAGEKLLNMKNKPPNWKKNIIKNDIVSKNELSKNNIVSNKNELTDISSFGKVSSFKKKLESNNIEEIIKSNHPMDSPIESINKVVKTISEKDNSERDDNSEKDYNSSELCDKKKGSMKQLIEDKIEEVIEEVVEGVKEEVVDEVIDEVIDEVVDEVLNGNTDIDEDHITINIGDFDK